MNAVIFAIRTRAGGHGVSLRERRIGWVPLDQVKLVAGVGYLT